MGVRFLHGKCKLLGPSTRFASGQALRVAEAKCLRFVGGHHPAPPNIQSIFTSDVPERLRIAGLIVMQPANRADAHWRLTKKGAALLRKLNAAHRRIVITR